ncbi:type II toxin-antitoxin system HicB family antitoxin [Flintibacter muris]|uniref:type II toxin-antitoxin system HicB family antitoxin n=1 Tax=Flintibacter muris TaxID=2941327 RepID=UPI00203AB917|nr:type II toxin-antitoxin system HicB family antitoxin [Flintibacter muris]
MDKLYYPAIMHPEDEGGYSVWLHDVSGCISQGETLPEAVENIKDALGLYYEDAAEGKSTLPAPSAPNGAELESGEFVVMIEFSPSEYLKASSTKAVKKTLSIPAWLNNMAEAQQLNFSAVLQSALVERLNAGLSE